MSVRPDILVLCRVGADHRIGGWAAVPPAARSWELALSPYEPAPGLDRLAPDLTLPAPGGKWEALHDILRARPDLWRGRRLIWLPDDDLEADPQVLERFFAIARARDLHLCQPALTPDSAFSHFVTVRHLFTSLRYTNFVELMAPLMTPQVLEAALPMMAGRAGAKGMDFAWTGLVPPPRAQRIAVIDAAAMAHRRPLGGALAPAMARLGRDLEQERAGLLETLPLARPPRSRTIGLPGLGTGPAARLAATLAGAATLLRHPSLWRRDSLLRAAKTLSAQLIRGDEAL